MIQKRRITLIEFLGKHHKIMLWIMLAAYFSISFLHGLIKGGRWDLYQHIAMADRFLNGQGFYYSTTDASSPYFPGVAFLSIFIGYFFNPWRDYILLAIASTIGAAFFYALIKLGELFSGNKIISLFVTSTLLFMGFFEYRGYMVEFKPDSAVLLIGVILTLIIDRMEKNKSEIGIKNLCLVFVLGFVMGIMKQHALYVDVALGLYLVFTHKFFFLEKIKILGSLILAGILDLIVIFSIPGIKILTIDNTKNMPYGDIATIIQQMENDFLLHSIFFILLFIFIVLLLLGKIELKNGGIIWLIIAVIFGCGQTVGGWKTGGNTGNYEVGMVTFLPFCVMAATYLWNEYFNHEKRKLLIGICNLVLCVMCLLALSCAIVMMGSAAKKIQTDAKISEYLSDKFGNETIMYHSNKYMQVARSTAFPGMDIYTTPSCIEEYLDTNAENIKAQKYKYLYVNPRDLKNGDEFAMKHFNHDSHALDMLEAYYVEINDPNMPEGLSGQLFVVREQA